MPLFNLTTKYTPSGDQPKAIKALVEGLNEKMQNQVLLGITGSGKTFTMANVIAATSRPALIIAHNKTLAAQIYAEMKELFPENAVEYFVSYYDYYQPEAYIPKTDLFIEKDASINEQIDLLRHSATRSVLERRDVIVVSSVSCIYGLGSPELYAQMTISFNKGQHYKRSEVLDSLVSLQYTRNDIAFERGSFRVKGEVIDIFPSHYATKAWKLVFWGDELEELYEFDPLTGEKLAKLNRIVVYSSSHFVTPRSVIQNAVPLIQEELREQINFFKGLDKFVEQQRIEQRTQYDIEMLLETGSCKGIENYSRYFSGRPSGAPPPTLFEYLPKDALLFVDESHVTVSQIRAMYNGDRARKQNLVDYGFRLPSARDNRPLKFEEWQELRPQTIFVSATPNEFELNESHGVIVEQVIRPTGLLDPECIIRSAKTQVEDLLGEIQATMKNGYRVLVTALTKKMAEDLTEYLVGLNYKAAYLHSEIHTLERVEIIRDLRQGNIDVLVGINLLREGLDIPECSLVAILDADKEGFLRSEVALIQTIGRAARNSNGRVLLYADVVTKSIEKAVSETARRRKIQQEYNKQNNIVPTTVNKAINAVLELEKLEDHLGSTDKVEEVYKDPKKLKNYIAERKKLMLTYASNLEFEKAAALRDEVKLLEESALDLL